MPSTVDLLNKFVAQWIRENTWAQDETPQSIVVVSKIDSSETIFRFHSAFSYFEIDAAYHGDTKSLSDLQIRLLIPGKTEGTIVAVSDFYPISTNPGQDLAIDLDNGSVKGKVSFQLRDTQESEQTIFVTYAVFLPFVGELENTISIDPTVVAEAAALVSAQPKDTFQLADLDKLKLLEGTRSSSETIAIVIPDAVARDQQALLIKFSKESTGGRVSTARIKVYTNLPLAARKKVEWKARLPTPPEVWKLDRIDFLERLQIDGSIDPKTLVISAALFGYIPVAGRARLAPVDGPLLDGVNVLIDTPKAKGQGTFSDPYLKSGKHAHELLADIKVKLDNYPEIATAGPSLVTELPPP